MSRAFVKEQDGQEAGEALPERVVSPHRNLVTAEGLAQIEAAVRQWRDSLSTARAADDRAASDRAERELRYWTTRRATAELVPAVPTADVVRFGSRVVLRREDGHEATFRIVGEDEADPARGLVSWVAPLARDLLGRETGESVDYAGRVAEILRID